MSRLMYDPEDVRNGKEFTYNLPIHENDDLLIGFSYREIMNEVVANYGHNVTEKEIRDQVRGHLEMAIENMEENLILWWIRRATCLKNTLKNMALLA